MSQVLRIVLSVILPAMLFYVVGAHYLGTTIIMPGGGGPDLFAPTWIWLFVAVAAFVIYAVTDTIAAGLLAIFLFIITMVLGRMVHVSWELWLWAATAAAVGGAVGGLFRPIPQKMVGGH